MYQIQIDHRSWIVKKMLSTTVLLSVFCAGIGSISGAWAAEKLLELNIVNGANASLADRVRVTQGDTVTLRCTSDQQVQIHLHGYDIEKTITPGSTVNIRFDAHATGRFPLTLHGSEHTNTDPGDRDHDDRDHDHDNDHEQEKSPQKHDEPTLFYLEVYPG